ncbi:MAG: histidinol-phosphate transaminase [Pseudomonadales bacterium]|nr:histidinol-phosphate transaminase [Pseudomonadales bacterium]
MNYERSNIKKMTGYTPGEQPDSAAIIKLNTNENPFPASPAVAAALATIRVDSLRRYPPPTALPLRTALAACHRVHADNIIVTNGGDELLRLAISTFVETSDAIAIANPSYSLYEVLAQAHGCGMIKLELRDDWSLPTDFGQQLNASGATMCLLVNPHAPSGQLTDSDELRQLAADFKGVLVIDEAYVDFVDPEQGHDCLPLIREFDNVLILRTFSKGYSLAGLRMAYGLAAGSLIAPMQHKTKDSYNTDFIAQTLARAAIESRAYAAETWAYVRRERTIMADSLQKMGFHSHPSQSNFLLVGVPSLFTAESLYEALKQRGILIRYFNQPRLRDKLRISLGTQTENARLIDALRDITGAGQGLRI